MAKNDPEDWGQILEGLRATQESLVMVTTTRALVGHAALGVEAVFGKASSLGKKVTGTHNNTKVSKVEAMKLEK